jgi:RNA-directed DNA polymerase
MYEELMEEVVKSENARRAYKAVVSNKGAAGIDGVTTQKLKEQLTKNWEVIRGKLLEGTYSPSPLRRVEIPKPDGGTRVLGIPTAQDRFVQQMLLQTLTPIFDPHFSGSSYGFRPGRSAHDAVKAAQRIAREGKTWVVDIDISRFFDHVNHDLLMHRIGQVIRDKRVLKLIGRYLRKGALSEGAVVGSEEGAPQGGPLSPLLANIYLDALDKELEAHGHRFCRYADDCNIYVSSEAAAQRVMEGMSEWLEKNLKLKVNAQKSGIGCVWERKFLGFQLNRELQITVSSKSIERLKGRVRRTWRACQSATSVQLRNRWQLFIRGWWGYYRLAENRRAVYRLEPWIRRHIRKCFWLRWHSVKGRKAALKRLGLRPDLLRIAHSSKGAWRMARSHSLHIALSNRVLRKYGFWMPSDLSTAL